jgi:hypothetical protein
MAIPTGNPTYADVKEAERQRDAAQAEFDDAERAIHEVVGLTTQQQAALVQRKNDAWRALEAARRNYIDVQRRAAASE